MRFITLLIIVQFAVASPLEAQQTDSTQSKSSATITFDRWPDSIQQEKVMRNIKQNGKSLDALLAERKGQEKADQRRMYWRIALGAIFLVVLAVSLARRFKK